MPGMRVAMGTQIDWSMRQAASISIKVDRGNQILGGGIVTREEYVQQGQSALPGW